ncbi:MAG: CRISPR-associated endonuclease Cas1 [Solirubrobacteraceae bacterium]
MSDIAAADELPPVPARIVNEFVYCPRLAYLEWVDHRFTDNADTVQGRFVHRRVDQTRGKPPSPDEAELRPASTSVTVASEALGVVAKLDLLESSDDGVTPIEYKRGSPRSSEEPLWPPERAQLALQVLLLRDAGYTVAAAMVWFAETRTRHLVQLSEEHLQEARVAVDGVRAMAERRVIPPPLVDSPKCPRCSLAGLCLPDEVNLLAGRTSLPSRRLVVSDPDAGPLYVTTPGARVTKRAGRVVLKEKGEEVASRRLIDVSHIALFGNADIGSALMRECFDHGIPVLWLTAGGWFSGTALGMPAGNVAVRMRQHRAAALGGDVYPPLFVSGKIRNQRTLLRRHGGAAAAGAVDQLKALSVQAARTTAIPSLLGVEGTAARIYFGGFARLLRGALANDFAFEGRNRRPPLDPVNAVMSFLSALLTKDALIALVAAGLDPYVGLMHQPRFGRPSLALDLAEEFRPLIVDSTVLMTVNNGEVRRDDFVVRAGGWSLTAGGRRGVIAAYERRMGQTLNHPAFGYVASYRRTLEIQARLLAAALVGDTPAYRPLTTR